MRTLVMVGFLLATRLDAQTPIRFADIPWGSDSATVTKLMAAQALDLDSIDRDGDYRYSGTLVRFDADVIAWMAPKAEPQNGLVKVRVILLTPDPDCVPAYRNMKGLLLLKYGPPSSVEETFDDPYHAGDGQEQAAFKAGKGHFSANWEQVSKNRADSTRISLYITTDLVVRVDYEGPRWHAEGERRGAKAF